MPSLIRGELIYTFLQSTIVLADQTWFLYPSLLFRFANCGTVKALAGWRGEEQNREEGEMTEKSWKEGEIGGKSREEGEKAR